MMYNTPEEFISAMRAALEIDDFYTAQELSFKAVEQYPDHQEIKKFADVLAPDSISRAMGGP